MNSSRDLDNKRTVSDVELLIARARRCISPEEAAGLDAQLHRIRMRLARSNSASMAQSERDGDGVGTSMGWDA